MAVAIDAVPKQITELGHLACLSLFLFLLPLSPEFLLGVFAQFDWGRWCCWQDLLALLFVALLFSLVENGIGFDVSSSQGLCNQWCHLVVLTVYFVVNCPQFDCNFVKITETL